MKIKIEFDVDIKNIESEKAKQKFMEKYFILTPSVIFSNEEDWEILINGITLIN